MQEIADKICQRKDVMGWYGLIYGVIARLIGGSAIGITLATHID